MNLLPMLAAQPWIGRLGMTLVHSLWQGAVIASIYAAMRRRWIGALGPNGRHGLACAALVAMVTAPVVTWMLLRGPVPEAVATTFQAPLSAVRIGAARPVLLPQTVGIRPATADGLLGWVVAFWLVGVAAFSFRLCRDCILAGRLRYTMARSAPSEWQGTLNRLKARIALTRPVRLLISGAVQAPAVLGWLRPVVLVPAGALTGLPPGQMEALLCHELAHLRRHDYLIHIAQRAVETILFYHPAVWWVSGHMRVERELCCDDLAVSLTGDKVGYARALAACAATNWNNAAVLGASSGSLAERIARLLGYSATPRRCPHPVSAATLAAALLPLAVAGAAIFAQSTNRLEFEVASIKASTGQGIQYVRPLPGRLTADADLRVLMQYAYGVRPSQVVGGPKGVMSARYQIVATADGNASRDQMFLMLQSLLEDRFHLQIHTGSRELPEFALVAAKGGLKLPPRQSGACVDSASAASPEWTGGGRMAAPGELPPLTTRCGSAGVALMAGSGARIQGAEIEMPELVRVLSMLLGRSVVDQTGASRPFNLKVDFVPDAATPSVPPPPPGVDLSGPSLPQALERQLGLRLESTRGPVKVIVVDRAERPSGN